MCGSAEEKEGCRKISGAGVPRKPETLLPLLHNLLKMGIIDTLRGTPTSVAKILAKSDDDGTSHPLLFSISALATQKTDAWLPVVVVTLAVRSPMCKAKKGGFKVSLSFSGVNWNADGFPCSFAVGHATG